MASLKRKRREASSSSSAFVVDPDPKQCGCHFFNDDEIAECRSKLLSWYDENKRTLPWRTAAETEQDDDVRGYTVWVSEIMLQQTRVATVVDYYSRWMAKWPSVEALAKASLEDVNKMWSGLGYYSRGKRLLEGARKIASELRSVPKTSEELQKQLPGVGKYTACAVASIAFGEKVGVVDGNVTRVISRLRRIGAESDSKPAAAALWKNADMIVDASRPGDFNQAFMELGATICTPKNPSCSECPLASACRAAHSEDDIEDGCGLCLRKTDFVPEKGTMNYPRKGKKTAQKPRKSLVAVFQCEDRYLLAKRPAAGLLANLLEFPHLADLSSSDTSPNKGALMRTLRSDLGLGNSVKNTSFVGEVFHQFSHISQTYIVWKVSVDAKENFQPKNVEWAEMVWLNGKEIGTAAISTAMKKVFQLVLKEDTKQARITDCFPPKRTKQS